MTQPQLHQHRHSSSSGRPMSRSDTAPEPEAPVAGDGSEEKPMEEATSSKEKEKEKEEEEAFLISLYKFMKDRHTPIERIPHLGFKQINLWKIYKAVEKLGAYELVTGRRLWKNVYDELGGSPGSTSAATCTRRHYERLVLPYVRHLKGEDDKPLPPSKPRKQYKVSKGTEMGEKGKRGKKEKGREQMPPDKAKPEAAAGPEDAERGRVAEGCSSPVALSPSGGCPDPCRTHSETYKRLPSSFSSKGNPPIMSPLAKKKLLAQVSKAESLHCPKRPNGDTSPKPMATSSHLDEQRSEVGAITGASRSGPATKPCPWVDDGGPVPAVFTGCFHAYRSEVLPPGRCPPLWGCFSSLKDFLEPPSCFPPRAEEQEQPQDLRSKVGRSWSGDREQVATVKGCWVPPSASVTPMRGKHGRGEEEEEEDEEAAFSPSVKLRAVSPFIKDIGCQQGLAKPKAVVATPGYTTPLPQAPDASKGAMLHFPGSFGNPLEHLKTQGVPVAPSLSINPFIIPAFPSPLVATGPRHYTVSYESSLRHRHYGAATWQSQPHSTPRHVPAFHRHAKLQ
ncbi:AT-rich interactive domain-containing protein 5A [Neopsephotus bourkii]|uniref:AT-rich interactive domain-containing protein 5A n=1 Tax=Neopsephotus bourkii TaxID=309878 RepID=UPI002AA5C5AC|nr:AT-rich interactive domain-containing protein 5A [Neopsephotus bourkii]